MAKLKLRPVIVTTSYRGIFFGYAEDTSGDVIKLKNARNCVYWPAEQKGFLGLATAGPVKGARIGPAAPSIELRGITSVIEPTAEAVEKWESAPWS